MMSSPRLLTIILNYRTAEMTKRSLAAASLAMQGIDGDIIVVDNDSQDGSFEVLTQHVAQADLPNVSVIASPKNGGFGAGNNHGIQAGMRAEGGYEFVYVLNSDAFPEPGAIQELMDHMIANPKSGFAGSLITGEDGAIHHTTFRYPSLLSEFEGAIRFGPVSRLLATKRVAQDVPETSQTVEWIAGASLMMRSEMLRKIGLFDESFFLYFEETELCRRGQLAGYTTDFVKESRVVHIGSVSTGMKKWDRTPQYWFQSRWYYLVTNHGRLHAVLATFLHVLGGAFHRLRQRLRGQHPADPPYFLRDLLRHDVKAALAPGKPRKIPALPTPSEM